MTYLDELEAAVQTAAERTGPAVVGLGRGPRVGSGVVIAPGHVLTNAHNLRHDEVTVSFADGRESTGQVAGADPDLDIAVIAVDTGELTPVPWLDLATTEPDEAPPVGRAVLALGNPGGRGLRVTPGFVSSTARSLRGPRGRRIAGAIEHTAPLPRGSSGGPLVDIEGTLLGINTVRADAGLILAIPADATLRERVAAIVRGEAPTRVRLGIALLPPRAAHKLRRAVGLPERDGVLIRAVEKDSPAAAAELQRGDLIAAVAGRPITSTEVLYDALDDARAATRLELTIVRGTDERVVEVSFA
ncbi:MAG TPA: trypsin-like peptidase domain-containing protein [Solirubrobacteraceae bacterium]|jgi:serine protease Do|nr:trypsin-like peptidase domain-containing protein [Solirubrobacteraceae bacterium]